MFWRRFVALATGFADKYRFEPFFRTEVNILALQALFSLLILGVVAVSLTFLYRDVSSVLIRGIQDSLTSQIPPMFVGLSIASQLSHLQTQNIGSVIAIIIIGTIVFGYIAARVTLLPARNALSAQKQFIGNIAHELRTPLSTIKTNTEVALFDASLPKDLRDILESNIEELDRISDIINNLLSLNSSVRPERLEFRNVDLSDTIDIVVKKLRRLAERKKLEITMRASGERLVWGNSTALEQIVSNVLKNAITYTGQRGHIGITIESVDQDTIQLSIQDSGSGISRKDLFRVFEPFYRAEPSRNRARGGSGLGLTIVSELVKLLSGKIAIRSVEKKGTTVIIQLPAGIDETREASTEDGGKNEIVVDFMHHTRE